jgi:hypothetical protein
LKEDDRFAAAVSKIIDFLRNRMNEVKINRSSDFFLMTKKECKGERARRAQPTAAATTTAFNFFFLPNEKKNAFATKEN